LCRHAAQHIVAILDVMPSEAHEAVMRFWAERSVPPVCVTFAGPAMRHQAARVSVNERRARTTGVHARRRRPPAAPVRPERGLCARSSVRVRPPRSKPSCTGRSASATGATLSLRVLQGVRGSLEPGALPVCRGAASTPCSMRSCRVLTASVLRCASAGNASAPRRGAGGARTAGSARKRAGCRTASSSTGSCATLGTSSTCSARRRARRPLYPDPPGLCHQGSVRSPAASAEQLQPMAVRAGWRFPTSQQLTWLSVGRGPW